MREAEKILKDITKVNYTIAQLLDEMRDGEDWKGLVDRLKNYRSELEQELEESSNADPSG
tara:strand:+ start:471 stop:650 length:180 start_codon:yes stop_codon:yes gene_type:complete